MKSHWRLFTDTKTRAKAERVGKRLLTKLGAQNATLQILPYHKGGYTVHFELEIAADSWPSAVVEVIDSSQLVGYGWSLSGSIREEVDLWSSKSAVFGVYAIHVRLGRVDLDASKYGYYEKVRVQSDDPKKASVCGELAAVRGKSANEDGTVGYVVQVYRTGVCWSVAENELVWTGEFDDEKTFYPGGVSTNET